MGAGAPPGRGSVVPRTAGRTADLVTARRCSGASVDAPSAPWHPPGRAAQQVQRAPAARASKGRRGQPAGARTPATVAARMPACPICCTPLPAARIASPDRGNATPGRFEVAICAECGAGVTLPVVGPEALGAFYPPGYGPHTQADQPIVALISRLIRWWQVAAARRRLPLAALRGRPPGRGLDVGAGRGDTAAMLTKRGWTVTAIEPDHRAASRIRERGINAREGVLGTVRLEPGTFDFALFQHSLEHTPDPVADLRRALEALRPGGLLLLSVPNFTSWQRRLFGGRVVSPRPAAPPGSLRRGCACARAHAGWLRRPAVRDIHERRRAPGLRPVPARRTVPVAVRHEAADRLRACGLMMPVTWGLDRLAGAGDTLHAVARRP